MFVRKIMAICKKIVLHIKITSMNKYIYGLSKDTKISLPTRPSSPHFIWQVENMKGSQKDGFSIFINDKTLLLSFSDQQLPAAKLFVHMFRRQQWKVFEIDAFYAFTTISVHVPPRLTQ